MSIKHRLEVMQFWKNVSSYLDQYLIPVEEEIWQPSDFYQILKAII
jgi:hypothetical protein